ncbi:HlyD family secretion protein [Chloracidobacterium thermophilum]|uniref:Multidrug resistance efflux pump n=1 Tax=Chloracidobacterium thermophilum (strain B) TaxID=981222 RepID=G2LFR8_CHLTF|nr:biotin/lipoyl-binding protein [Chloracidobacterium thermophilum]AEP11712.1 Multidrug resistance efflux pump [Chloracidobacterium thermophilum B]QUV79585.1 biotin/lipoyl-binding protein [Chloracidobacterium thermophilum]
MIKKVLSVVLPIVGLSFAIWWVIATARQPIAAPPVSPPAESRFDRRIAGAGIVEAATRNVSVAPPLPGLVTAVFVKENDVVRAGDRLYQIDDREQRARVASADANIARAEAAVATARADLSNGREAVRVARANLDSARANLAAVEAQLVDAEQIVARNEKLYAAGDIAERVLISSRAARDAAQARVSQAQAQVAQAQAQIDQAEAQVRSIEARLHEAEAQVAVLRAQRTELAVNLSRLTVVAPQDGKVLQVNVRVGETLPMTPATPPVLLGNTDYLQLRVDVDEINASRIRPNLKATASLKGDATKTVDLEFVRIDPYILPKRSLTGDNAERVDVRVLQVIYRFRPPAFPVYVGQQMDVFIDAE